MWHGSDRDVSWVRKEINVEGAEPVAAVLVCVSMYMAVVDAMNEMRRCREEEFERAERSREERMHVDLSTYPSAGT